MEVGQHWQYIYKQAGQEFTVDAEIVSIHGSAIEIKFGSPGHNYTHYRTLRTAQDRARLVDYRIPRPGAPAGNQNAKKKGVHRVAFSLSYANTRLDKATRTLQNQGHPVTSDTLRSLTYAAIDAYLGNTGH